MVMIEWNEWDVDMIRCDDFVKMNDAVVKWLWWFQKNEWGGNMVGSDDFETWMTERYFGCLLFCRKNEVIYASVWCFWWICFELLYCFNLSLKHFCEYTFLIIFADPVLWSWVSVLFCHPFQSSQQVSLLELFLVWILQHGPSFRSACISSVKDNSQEHVPFCPKLQHFASLSPFHSHPNEKNLNSTKDVSYRSDILMQLKISCALGGKFLI